MHKKKYKLNDIFYLEISICVKTFGVNSLCCAEAEERVEKNPRRRWLFNSTGTLKLKSFLMHYE